MIAPAHKTTIDPLPLRVVNWLGREARELAPAVGFFLVGFGFILLLLKLFVAQYSIEIPVISRALLGALIAAKATLVMDKIGLARSRGYPAIVMIVGRTGLYSLVAIVLGLAEQIVHGWRESGSLEGALALFHDRFRAGHFFAIVLCVAVLFACYFSLREIKRRLGEGVLYAIFFGPPDESLKPPA
jgi:hypothetical protein